MNFIKQKLFIDFDGTITRSAEAYIRTYKYYYENIPGYEKPNTYTTQKWDLSDICPLAANNCENLFGSHYFFAHLQPFENAIKVLERLNEKYEVWIVTIGTLENISNKSKWIEKNLPFIKNAIFINNDGIKMNKDIVDMSGGIFVDDVYSNLKGSNADFKICFGEEKEWNKDFDSVRVKSWLELENVIEYIIKQKE